MIRKEFVIFLVVGSLTVLVDFLMYHLFLWVVFGYSVAKAIGFVSGTVFAYFANRSWTFGHIQRSRGSAFRFGLLYSLTLGTNVLSNYISLIIFDKSKWAVHTAFLFATLVSATLNFIGMKFFVFRSINRRKIMS